MPHIVNMKEADLKTATAAGTHSQLGMVCKVTGTAGARVLTPLTDTDDALVLMGNYAVAMKYSADGNEATSSTVPSALGSRIATITAGDIVLECRRGTIIEYKTAELGSSLQGAFPTVGQDLGIASSLWSTIAAATTSGIATPVVGRVHQTFGTASVQIELL